MKGNVYAQSKSTSGKRSKPRRNSYDDDYVNTDVFELHGTRSNNTATVAAGAFSAERRCWKLTVVCLVLLCVFLLTAIIILLVKFTAERETELQTRYNNLTMESDQLQTRHNNLAVERDQLQARNNNLAMKSSRLLNKLCQKENDPVLSCDSSSVYYLTKKKKNWIESRLDCIDTGADLVIINNKEEQEVISKQFHGTEAWIGLTDRETEGVFKWVDGSELSTKFWWDQEPNNYGGKEDCAITGYKSATSDLLTWADYPCDHPVFAICEKFVSE